jgi:uncharacterized protein with von Willebrand factor type A (vWA) domain
MLFRYTEWDGTQSIPPLDPDDLLDLLSQDLLEDGDLRRALERLLMRGARRGQDGRPQGMRDLLERLRQRREQQLGQYDLGSFMDEINERLQDIVHQEREGIERLRDQAATNPDADAAMREMAQQLYQRKQRLSTRCRRTRQDGCSA